MSIVRNLQDGGVIFFCPGCKDVHAINSSSTDPQWSYNGDPDKPTFSPSVLYRSGHHIPGEAGKPCWCTFEDRFPEYKGKKHPFCYVCHSFVTDGRIQFLSDCTHQLAGQTVDLPQWPYAPGSFYGLSEDDQ